MQWCKVSKKKDGPRFDIAIDNVAFDMVYMLWYISSIIEQPIQKRDQLPTKIAQGSDDFSRTHSRTNSGPYQSKSVVGSDK